MIGEYLSKVNELFEDELSKKIFDARTRWYFSRDGIDETIDMMYDYYKHSRILGLESYPIGSKYVICGAGHYGDLTYRALTHAGYEVFCFLDNDANKKGNLKNGVPIKSFFEFVAEYPENCIVIIDNLRLQTLFFNELCELGFPQSKIYCTPDNTVRTLFGNIYFDLPQIKPSGEDVFIDAGCFSGETTFDFINWCNGKYKSIYAFEPMQDGYELSKCKLKGVKNLNLYKAALSDQVGAAHFAQSFAGIRGARLGKRGDYVEEVKLETIDHVLSGERATFIKMDIEGAELAALKGAEYTLKTYKPSLAISLYHKNEDMYEIPLWLKETVPEYKFYLRHYSNKRWDLVLYCVVI